MHEVSLVRLYVLRATFLLIILGMGPNIWTLILQSSGNVEHMRGVVWSVLGAVSLLAVLGLRYPLKMLPLLFVELTWKTIWILAIGLPLWSAGRLDEATRETWNACLMGIVVFGVAIPWRYVWTRYVSEPGDRWSRGVLPVPPAEQVRT